MSFASWEFFLFFPVVTAGYFAIPHAARWAWLLGASCLFYMAFVPSYLAVLAATVLVDYFAAIIIERSEGRVRRLAFYASIAAACLILFFFKYFGFFSVNVNAVASAIGWNYGIPSLKILLPIGLSFYTLQSLSYVIEVYRGTQRAERHLGIYALYVSFYPQLVAGPIERPAALLPQFRARHGFDYYGAVSGLKIIFWGLFKKVVIADRLALFVDPVYASPDLFSGATLLLATLFFSVQVYCDFSGYSDVAVGAARVMGFRLTENFTRPYSAAGLSEFWQRWHISLSLWLRDYIYMPLAFRLRHFGRLGGTAAIMVTLLLSGLWHGASWNFLAWGILHGAALCLEAITAGLRRRAAGVLPGGLLRRAGVAVTFAFVTLSFVFFRAASLGDALSILSRIFSPEVPARFFYEVWQAAFSGARIVMDFSEVQFRLALVFSISLGAVQSLRERDSGPGVFASYPALRWCYYYAAVSVLLALGVWFHPREFIYFQF